MDTEKRWDEFEKNESQFRKSESVQQDIQQILDTVTQIKSDVDQLKEEGPKATGIADEEPSLSAPEEGGNQPPMGGMGGAPPMPETGAEPQAPMGDLMAQPEEGSATPMPEAPMSEVPPVEGDMMGGGLGGGLPPLDLNQYPSGLEEPSDEDILLNAVKDVKNPELKKQLLALTYQSLEQQTAPIEPVAPPLPPDMNGDGQLSPEDGMLADAMMGGAPGPEGGEVPPEVLMEALAGAGPETNPMYRSAQNPALQITADVNKDKSVSNPNPDTNPMASSDDEKKDDDEDKDDEKKDDGEKEDEKKEEPFEPGVTGMPESKDEDNDSTEETPAVTQVTIEEEDEDPLKDEKAEAIGSIVDTVLENAKEKITEQVVDTVEGMDDTSEFMLSTSTGTLMKARYGKKLGKGFTKSNAFKRSIDWPEDVKSLPMEEKCRYFAKAFNSMDNESQDAVIGLMDRTVGPEKTNAIFKSEGVDLEKIYKSDDLVIDSSTSMGGGSSFQDCNDKTVPTQESYGVMGTEQRNWKNDDVVHNQVQYMKDYNKDATSGYENRAKRIDKDFADDMAARAEMEDAKKKKKLTKPIADSDDSESFQNCSETKKSADVGIHIPTVNEMLAFKKSGMSAYTPMPRDMAEPHGLVKMDDNSMEVPSTRELLERFTKH